MQPGMIGPGRTRVNMVRRPLRAGHEYVVCDISTEAVEPLAREGTVGAPSLEVLVQILSSTRAVWMMLSASPVEEAGTVIR